MEKLNASQIIEKIREIEDEYDRVYELEKLLKEDLGDIDLVNEEGDSEGAGEYSEKVYHFKNHDIYLKVTGCYTSYNGCDWNDDWAQVFPKEKTIVVYTK